MAAEMRAKWERKRWRIDGVFAGFILVQWILSMHAVSGAVMSIDLGSEWMKVAVVNLKPGQSPISIALNEMSKRKSSALVAFSNGDRLVAEEASGISGRYPERVYSRVRDFLGKPVDSVNQVLEENYLPYDLVEDSRGSASIQIHDKKSVYRSEELLASLFSYGRDLAEAHAKGTVKDAVITVPPYFGQAERQGILDAAQIAGITVLSLINEHSGAALQYGIDKDFQNETRNVVFYDMGANSLYAAVVQFSAYSGKDRGKTVSFNQFQVKGVQWDASLGGQSMEQKLVDYFSQEFNQQLGKGEDVRRYPKAMAKLKKQVRRTKEILSANTEAPLSVEALHEDLDFRSSITREKFERLCGDLWARAVLPLKQVLSDAGLKLDEIYAVELIGGATRVPKLQAVLSEFLGKKSLDRHLDADEAVALGAALQAANLSDGFKLNRKLGMIDGASYSIILKLDGATDSLDSGDESMGSGQQVLFQKLKKLPSKVFRTLKNQKEDFQATLLYDSAEKLPPGITTPELSAFQISGVADAAKKYESYNLSSPIKTNLHFSLSRSGIIYLDKAESVVEVSEWVDIPVKNTSSEANNTSASGAAEDTKGLTGEENKDESKVVNEVGKESELDMNPETQVIDEASQVAGPTQDGSVIELPTKKKLRKRTIRVPLKIKDLTKGSSHPLSDKDISEAVLRLEVLRIKDNEKKRTAEAKNSLEAYIYATKDKLDSLEDLETVSNEQQRDAVRAELSEAEDWLYMDGEDASAAEFKKKLEVLKAKGDSIFFRLRELKARPEAVESARMYIQEVQETVEGWETTKPWISRKSKDEVIKATKLLVQWLDESEANQQKLERHKDPVLTSDKVYDEVKKLKSQVAVVNRISKPKPKVERPPEKVATEEKASTTKQDQPEKSFADEKLGREGGQDVIMDEDATMFSPTDQTLQPPQVHDEL